MILVVDDDQIVRETLVMALTHEGLPVVAADDIRPEAVLATASASGADLVLLDFHLEQHTSLELIEPLRATGASVLMLTGSADDATLGACLEQGAVGAIRKRQPLADLLAAITLAVEGMTVQRPAERDGLISAARQQRRSQAEALAPFEAMTARERSVLGGLMDGLSAEEIASRDFVSLPTVRTQIRGILQKLDVSSQLAAVARARRAGWAPPPGEAAAG